MQKDSKIKIVLSSGAELNAYDNIIGIGPDFELYGGYDDRLDEFGDLTTIEKIELADKMISRWQNFKQSIEQDLKK